MWSPQKVVMNKNNSWIAADFPMVEIGWALSRNQVGEHGRNNIFFLRSAFSNHQRHGHQCIISNTLVSYLIEKEFVLFRKAQEHSGGNPFISIHKTVIFHKEIEQVRGLFFSTEG